MEWGWIFKHHSWNIQIIQPHMHAALDAIAYSLVTSLIHYWLCCSEASSPIPLHSMNIILDELEESSLAEDTYMTTELIGALLISRKHKSLTEGCVHKNKVTFHFIHIYQTASCTSRKWICVPLFVKGLPISIAIAIGVSFEVWPRTPSFLLASLTIKPILYIKWVQSTVVCHTF